MLRRKILRGLADSNPSVQGISLCRHGLNSFIEPTNSASEIASKRFSAAAFIDYGDRGYFLRASVFSWSGSIIALFGSGRKIFSPYVASGFASSNCRAPDVFLPGSPACRQFSSAGKANEIAPLGKTYYASSKSGFEELKKNGEGESDKEEGLNSTGSFSDCDAHEGHFSSDCSTVNDAVIIQRLFKGHKTRNEREQALNQCGVVVSGDLVVQVLYRHENDWKPAMFFFVWASQQPGFDHGTKTYHAMLNILGKVKRFHTMWQLIKEMHNRGNSPSLITDETFTILMRRYAAAHMVERAIETFFKREEFGLKLDTLSFQTLLLALCRYKHVQEAEALLHLRQHDFPPDMKTRNIILNGWCALANVHEAKRFWNELIKQGHTPDLVTYGTFIKALTNKGKLHAALKLFRAMRDKGCIPDVTICNILLDSLCFKKRIPEALIIFGEMNNSRILPNAATYNSLIKHICNIRRMDKAYELLDDMERKGCVANAKTYHYFLRVARKPEALKIMQRMVETGCKPTSDTYNLLLKMFFGWNELGRVLGLWDEMEEMGMGPDRRSYTVMIHGLYEKGKFDEACKFFNEMNAKGLVPEARTKILMKDIKIKAEGNKPGKLEGKKATKRQETTQSKWQSLKVKVA
eukprot:Gb_12358 [translate_table: standard]